MCKDINYCYFLQQTREAMIKTNPEIWYLNLRSIDEYYLRFGQIIFLASAVNQHGDLSSPKTKFKNPKSQNILWNIQRLKDPIQSLWNNRRHFAERDTICQKPYELEFLILHIQLCLREISFAVLNKLLWNQIKKYFVKLEIWFYKIVEPIIIVGKAKLHADLSLMQENSFVKISNNSHLRLVNWCLKTWDLFQFVASLVCG